MDDKLDRSEGRIALWGLVLLLGLGMLATQIYSEKVPVPGESGVYKTSAKERAQRRLFDGAPPVIPHENFHIHCTDCHNLRGVEVKGVGFSPPSPHSKTMGLSDVSNCRQCHVFHVTDDVFVENDFVGIRQDLRKGKRLNDLAPPVIPHQLLMRENCMACHTGPAAREEIRCDHPERINCRQCHARSVTTSVFER